MRLTASERAEVIRNVARSQTSINLTGIHKRTFYNWYHRYALYGEEGLKPRRESLQQWNTIPQEVRNLVVETALENTELSPREVEVKIVDEEQTFISESSAYRILKVAGSIQRTEHVFISAADEFHTKTKFANQM